MELLSKELPPNHNLILAGDTHDGTVHFHRDAFLEMVEKVGSKKNTYLALAGDLLEAREVDHPYFESDTSTNPTPIKQAEDIVNILRPIRKKILVINKGNHCAGLKKVGDVCRDLICNPLCVPYGTYVCKLEIRCDGKRAYKIYLAHGWGTIRSVVSDPIRREAALLASLKNKLFDKAADCEIMAMGHTHKLLIAKPMSTLYLTDDGKKIHQHYTGGMSGDYIHPDHRWYVNTGSFLKLHILGVDGYAERAGYGPLELGYAEVIVRNGKIQTIERRVVQ